MSTIEDKLEAIEDAYEQDADEERPLRSYAGILAAYVLGTGTLAAIGRRRLPGRLAPADLALGSVATYKLARLLTEDPITSPLRAPFTTYEGLAGPSALREEVRGQGWRHAVGELLTCPFCISQWVATSLVAGLALAPRPTRTFMSILALVSASEALQLLHSRVEQAARG
ncbi:MAG TPA: DUF1360 domain-containing protein [Acidimicrobiales bacterium]|jgi:hypothetical protein|nr:DUF1360 domain-containing protein [Acidimicrobiales bacterium]